MQSKRLLRHLDHSKNAWYCKSHSRWAGLILFCLACVAPLLAESVRGDRWLADVKFLASDDLKGRGDGTSELETAADYIAQVFRKAGLQPVNGSYFQPFESTVGSELGPNNRLLLEGKSQREYKMKQEFIPLSFSSSGTASGEIVFAGYGITAPEYHYDDYNGVNVKGKIVLILRHEPQEEDANSVFQGRKLTRHASLYSKAINARNHGATAMILVNDTGSHPDDRLVRFGDGASEGMGILAVHVLQNVAEPWIKAAGHTLSDLQTSIDKDLSNHSFALPSTIQVELDADVQFKKAKLKNVAAFLPGSDPKLRDEVIVIGAHYDHLGLGEYGSLAPSMIGKIHHGADDNASGTAGMLELARVLSADGNKPRRSILFLAFAGEELGLFGSAYYVEQPLIPLSRTITMLNLDMIGRVNKNKLFVGGVGTSPGFRNMVDEENKLLSVETVDSIKGGSSRARNAFQLDFSDSGYDSSDHMSFARKDVPVMFFFSGLHADYHKPSDTWDKVEPDETAQVLDLVDRIVRRIDSADNPPMYTRPKDDRRAAHAQGESESEEQGYGPYFGSIPDFGESAQGVRFADVQSGSPADKAGLKMGDILVEFDGNPIQNLYDFTYALRAKKPDDEVKVVVLRSGEKVSVTVKLGRR